MIVGRVATIMGRTIPTSCNQCGPGDAMIAVPSTDVCGPLQVAVQRDWAADRAKGAEVLAVMFDKQLLIEQTPP
jgi:hypothetical protein